jgi:RNA polymerase sigma-70 factor (ECF subfamily)
MSWPRLGTEFDTVLTAAQDGAEWAIAALYRTLQPAVVRYLSARAGDDGEDLAAETWLDVARKLQTFSGDEAAFRSFVFTVAHRRLVDHRRVRSRRLETTTPVSPAFDVPYADDPAGRVLERLAGAAAARRVADILPPAQAEVILLRVVAGLSAEEVGRVVGRRPGAVRVLQHRALRRLAAALGEPEALTVTPRRRPTPAPAA